ncbi:MAG: MerR family transcriptional regulator [Deltaproteobacteria bacterium]|jgi:DNA-binding transcriptional MerR regulator|nr:MerR family transcriptional regulator [Deltaproteobacteria bacterium]
MDSKQITYYIGELAEQLGLSQRTIRYYEELGFIKPCRTSGGFRTYDKLDADMLKMILRFKDLGMSLEEIRSLLLPSDGVMNTEVLSTLKETLKSRRKDFEIKINKYRESMEQIESVLNLLSKCSTCGQPETGHVCSDCLKEHEKRGEHITPFVSSLLATENTKES